MIIKDRKIIGTREMPENYIPFAEYNEETLYDAIQELCNKHNGKLVKHLVKLLKGKQVFIDNTPKMHMRYDTKVEIPIFEYLWELVVYIEKG